MDLFSNVSSPCERCVGTGFRDEVLEVGIDGKTIFDALQVPFDETEHLPMSANVRRQVCTR
jgi:excinuclease UvrABC ATPase subunit